MTDDLTPSGDSAVRLALEVGRLRRECDELRATVARVQLLCATWEGDSIGTDRYCAAELRAALEQP